MLSGVFLMPHISNSGGFFVSPCGIIYLERNEYFIVTFKLYGYCKTEHISQESTDKDTNWPH